MKSTVQNISLISCLILFAGGCKIPGSSFRKENTTVPSVYNQIADSGNIAKTNWRNYFNDKNLTALIDTALKNNQELNITLQEIEISRNEIRARKGEYLPFAGLNAGAGVEKAGRYTRNGAIERNIDIEPGIAFPEPLHDYMIGAYSSWELDVWGRMRNARKAAVARYLASVEGRNFMVTNLISEIAVSYYELMGLDNQLAIVRRNINIQTDALQTVKQMKEAAKVSQLAVNRFEAQLFNTKTRQYDLLQQVIETENRINFLTGRYPQPIARDSATFFEAGLDSIYAGIPAELLFNRPDIRQAERELEASHLDVESARANFYPSFNLRFGLGFQSFKPVYLFKPESMLYTLAGELAAPLINRNAIKAAYRSSNAKQIQSVYNYERTILNGYIEVVNQLAKISNSNNSYQAKEQEVNILTHSVGISNNLFRSARADYVEVLLTQREALDSRIELIDIKVEQLKAKVNVYKALGGGWN
jgi:multidrug efflux system outer membrane protein